MWLTVIALLLATPGDDIRRVLEAQAADWNRGDIDAFMQAYENSPSTAFVSKDGVRKGHAEILARYRQRYGSREKMGALTFSDIDVRMLGTGHAVATGRYRLVRTEAGGGAASGWFSLVLAKSASGWKVLLDHTSASQ